jgi:CheY-like chemotaxis protein
LTRNQPGILVVEDFSGIRRLLDIALRQDGFAVWLAVDGLEALHLYEQHREFIDVVLIDVQLHEMDGLATLAALQSLNPDVRCCCMSGNPGPYTEKHFRARGAAFIWKPFELAELCKLLRQLSAGIFPADGDRC